MKETQERLIAELKVLNVRLFEYVWQSNGPMQQALKSRIISDTYNLITHSTGDELKKLRVKETEYLAALEEHIEQLKSELRSIDNSNPLFEEYHRELTELEIERNSYQRVREGMSDFELLNDAYGLRLTQFREREGERYNVKMTPYFALNRIKSEVVESYFESLKKIPEDVSLLIDVIFLNSFILGLRQPLDQTFKSNILRALAGGRDDPHYINKEFYLQLAARIRSLMEVLNQNFAEVQGVKNPRDTRIIDIINATRDNAMAELKIIGEHLSSTNIPEAETAKGAYNRAIYIESQSEIIKRLLPLKKEDSRNLDLREHLLEVAKTQREYSVFANTLLDFIDGKISVTDLVEALKTFTADQIKMKTDTSFSSRLSSSFFGSTSAKREDNRERFAALELFRVSIIDNMSMFLAKPSPPSLQG